MGSAQETWGERRQQILRAAMEVLVHEGASSLTIRGVAKAAGVDPALIYHYFSSKADLLEEVTCIPLDLAAELADPTRDLAAKLTVLEHPAASLWLTALMIYIADARQRGSERFASLLDLLIPGEDLAKRTMVVGLLFQKHLLQPAGCEAHNLRIYTHLVETV